MPYIFFFIIRFSFSNVQGSHRPWATRFVACELLSMLNLIAQVGPRCDDDNDDDDDDDDDDDCGYCAYILWWR